MSHKDTEHGALLTLDFTADAHDIYREQITTMQSLHKLSGQVYHQMSLY